MRTIDLEGIPEPIAQAIAQLVAVVRAEMRTREQSPGRVDFLTRPGSVIGGITREEIYEEHLDHKFPPIPQGIQDDEDEESR